MTSAGVGIQPWPPRGEQLFPLPSALLREFAGLTGPVETFGTCLAGSIEAGDLIWYDTRIPPRHGDFVVIQMHPDRQRAFEQRHGQSPGAPHLGIKRLEQRDGEWFLSADDYPEGFPVSDNIILGPVVFRLSRLHRAGTQGQAQRLRQKHGTLAREIQSFVSKAKSPAEKLMARRQLEQLEKIRAKQQTLERAVIEAETRPALPKAHCNSLHFGPGTQLEAIGTPAIEPGAATGVYSTTATGPVTVELNAPSTEVIDRVLWVSSIATQINDIVEVTASYRVGVSGSGGTFTVKTAAIRRVSSTGAMTFVPTMEKTTSTYEAQTVVGTFTQSAGTYDFGIGVEIDGDGVNSFDAIFRDINVRVTVIRR